ncbi:MAG: L-fucose:H+ symporter permease [Bacteroidota bacterium]|jgi:FHS family L-fucose permease-like MFS transporter
MSNNSYRGPFAAMGVLFFMIGFITCLNDILVPHMKSVFDLSYTQAALIQFCFFTAYFVIAFPSSSLISRLGYQRSIVVGLGVSTLGAALFYPASIQQSYPLFLVGLFTLASGFALLQTAMNPYVAVLGPPQSSSARLVLSQAFNSVGTTIAPWLGGLLILGASVLTADQTATLAPEALAAYKTQQAAAVQMPYIVLTAMLAVLAVIVGFLKLPVIGDVEGEQERAVSLWAPLKVPHLFKGMWAIFAYVGAEVAIGSFMVNYFMEKIPGMTEQSATTYVTYYWGGAMIGRFVGSYLLTLLRPGLLLGVMSSVNVLLTLGTTLTSGATSAMILVGCGLFNSIMFATIFTLAIKDVGVMTNRGSSWLIAAILGGAVIPQVQGFIADSTGGLTMSYLIPVVCYIYIAYYGFSGSNVQHDARSASA